MTYLGINVNTLKSHRTVKLYVSTHWNCMAPLNHTCQHVEIALWNFTCQHVEIALWNHTCQHIEIASWNCSGQYIEIALHREIVHVNTLKSHRIVKSFMSTHWNRIASWNCTCQCIEIASHCEIVHVNTLKSHCTMKLCVSTDLFIASSAAHICHNFVASFNLWMKQASLWSGKRTHFKSSNFSHQVLNWAIHGHFYHYFHLFILLAINNCLIEMANGRIGTWVLRYWKLLVCQISQNYNLS